MPALPTDIEVTTMESRKLTNVLLVVIALCMSVIAAKEIGVIEMAQAQSPYNTYNISSFRALGCFHDIGSVSGCVDKQISVDEHGRVIVVVSK
jgi:hypothetical protein